MSPSGSSIKGMPTITSESHINERFDPMMSNSKKKDLFHLRKLITKHKVQILSNNFISKLRQNNTQRKPPDDGFLESG
jgi:hypothetical protein